jgi:hypothetical protein
VDVISSFGLFSLGFFFIGIEHTHVFSDKNFTFLTISTLWAYLIISGMILSLVHGQRTALASFVNTIPSVSDLAPAMINRKLEVRDRTVRIRYRKKQ